MLFVAPLCHCRTLSLLHRHRFQTRLMTKTNLGENGQHFGTIVIFTIDLSEDYFFYDCRCDVESGRIEFWRTIKNIVRMSMMF
jgi:hypothetical protein